MVDLNEEQFRPIKITQGAERAGDISDMATRMVATYNATDSATREAGANYYPREAHGAARAIASGVHPDSAMGKFLRTMPSAGQMQRLQRGPTSPVKPNEEYEQHVRRAAGAIARLSPSGGGMHWESNPAAAYEAGRLPEADVQKLMRGGTKEQRQKTRQDVLGKGALSRASSHDVIHAQRIMTGQVAPEEDIKTGEHPERVKIGSFYHNIAHPDTSPYSTIDARQHDTLTGVRRPWKKTDFRELRAKGRYDMLEEAQRQATMRINMGRYSRGEEGLTPSGTQSITWLGDRAAQEYGFGNQGGKGRKGHTTPLGQEGMAPHSRFTESRDA